MFLLISQNFHFPLTVFRLIINSWFSILQGAFSVTKVIVPCFELLHLFLLFNHHFERLDSFLAINFIIKFIFFPLIVLIIDIIDLNFIHIYSIVYR